MTWFQIYALFGSPVVLMLVALAVVWITGIQDRRSAKHLAEKHRAAE
jgi:hypothetical protein